MRIDWKSLPTGLDAFDAEPLPKTDWTDPTHVPLMVADAVAEIGNESGSCFFDHETGEPDPVLYELESLAIDAMPLGERDVRDAIQARVREYAAAEGWSDMLYEPGTNRYPWEAS